MRVAFFIPEYPSLYETFIINELSYLQESGIAGRIFYGRPGPSRVLQPVARRIKFQKTHIHEIKKLREHPSLIFATQLRLILHSPSDYLKALLFLLSKFSYVNTQRFIRASLLTRIIIQEQVDLIYIHDSEGVTLIGLFCKIFSGLPCGIIFHTFGLFANDRLLHEKVTTCEFSIFQSKYSKNYVRDIIHANQELERKMHVVSSTGVDVDFFSPLPSLKRDPSTISIISVGRLEKMKGFDRLIRAVLRLKQKRMKVRCTIIGNGFQYHALRSLISNLHLENDIKLPGEIGHNNKLLKIMSRAELFVLPSVVDNEGDRDMQPNVIKEAMSMELLTVTVKLGGIDEVITDKVNGFLLPSANVNDIADMIEWIWKLPLSVKMRVKKKARRVIVERYEARKINTQLISLFTKYTKAKN